MKFSFANEVFLWSPDFGPGSNILTVKVLVQGMTVSSLGIPKPSWNLLL